MGSKGVRNAAVSAANLYGSIESLPETVLSELKGAIRTEAREMGFLLQAEGQEQEVIPLALSPWVVRRQTARYLQSLFRGMRRTVNRILADYFEDPKLQEILPLKESELAWLKAGCSEGIPRPQTIFERFDTNLGPNVEEQLSTFQIIEFNAVGVGCIYLMPAATEIIQKHLLPRLKEAVADLDLVPPADYRQLLLDDLRAHSKGLDCSACRVALVERRESTPGGVDEFARIAEYFKEKGSPTLVGDPREVEHRSGEFLLKGEPIDVVYRDFQLEEVVSIKTHGGSVDGIEAAFQQNRVVSTVFGEFDHKSLCELLTNPEFSHYLTPQEIRAARRRVPWTRLIEQRRTTDWEGREIDLLPTIQAHRERLVLKPNRGYGGEGVMVGESVTDSVWSEALNRAVEKPKGWVIQEKVPISKASVMILNGAGRLKKEEQFVTLSVTATSRGVAFVGRCSSAPVVNISQGGGLVPVFLSGGSSNA